LGLQVLQEEIAVRDDVAGHEGCKQQGKRQGDRTWRG
jgi:hypothetical protein